MAIFEAYDAGDIAACRTLFLEYRQAVGAVPCFEGFDHEVATLPGDYGPPRGRLWLAHVDDEPAGCVALRPIAPRDAEIKRLFVRPRFRGRQLGRALAECALETARQLGYVSVRLDTLPTMVEAQALYERLGFQPVARYNDNPVEGVRFLVYDLRPRSQLA